MKKIILSITIFYCCITNSVLPPGSCNKGEIQVTAAGIMGGQCVSEQNLNETLSYLNEMSELNITDRELVRACNELRENSIDNALEYLHLNEINKPEGNKIEILKAACNGLNYGFSPAGPKMCEEPVCPTPEPCTKDQWERQMRPNLNCQKPGLNGKCLEYRECPMF